MKIIKAATLELAMEEATAHFLCSVTELHIEVVEQPKGGVLGFFKKQAVIAVVKKVSTPEPVLEKTKQEVPSKPKQNKQAKQPRVNEPQQKREPAKKEVPQRESAKKEVPQKESVQKVVEKRKSDKPSLKLHNHDMFAPSLVTAQDDYEEIFDDNEYKKSDKIADTVPSKQEIQKNIAQAEKKESSIKRVRNGDTPKNSVVDEFFEESISMDGIVSELSEKINKLFAKTCFTLNEIAVSIHDENTILVEFTGDDAALLIGKEGYRYKALSYMLFNWINAKYKVQLRLEIAEFLKNQEEMIYKYLEGVSDQINKNGRAQTKILDGVLVQIALKRLRLSFPEKYVAIRTNRDGLKYIIINSFRSNNG